MTSRTKISVGVIMVLLILVTVHTIRQGRDTSFSDTGTSTVAQASKSGFWASLTNWFEGKESTTADGNSPANTVPAKQYTNDTYHFSLLLPEALREHRTQDPSGSNIVVFQNDSKTRGFQISMRAFDEPGPLTETRIRKDIPASQMIIDSAEQIAIGQGGYPALAFYSQDAALDDTKEIWLIHNGYLYQISGYAKHESWLAEIVNTLQF